MIIMGMLPQQTTVTQYLSNGDTNQFTYPFLLLDAGDVNVYLTPAGNAPNPTNDLLPSNAYTVIGVGTVSGGTILLNNRPDYGDIITIVRNMAAAITTEFVNVQNFNGQNLDDAFQRTVMIEQQNQTLIENRNLGYIINSDLPVPPQDTQLPVLQDQQIWQKVGEVILNVTLVEGEDVSTLRSQLASRVEGADGASIVGFYDAVTPAQTTVAAYLASLKSQIISLSGVPLGTISEYSGFGAPPTGYLDADGLAISRTTYADYFALCAIPFSGTTDGGAVITGIADTSQFLEGDAIESPHTPTGTTILTIDTMNQMTLTNAVSFTGVEDFKVYRYGNGDGSTTFNLPNKNNLFNIGKGIFAQGETGGSFTKTILIENMPAHTHTYDHIQVGGEGATGSGNGNQPDITGSTGGDVPLDITPPCVGTRYIVLVSLT